MLINLLIEFVYFVFDLLPSLPQVPEAIEQNIDTYMDYMFQGMGLLSIAVNLDVFKVLMAITIVVFNFEHITKAIMFVVKKIPFLSIK